MANAIEAQCDGAIVHTRSSTTTGVLLFEAATFTITVDDATTYFVRYPMACTQLFGGCEGYGQVLRNLGFDGTTCRERDGCQCTMPATTHYSKSGTWQSGVDGIIGTFDDGGEFRACGTSERMELEVDYAENGLDRLVWQP